MCAIAGMNGSKTTRQFLWENKDLAVVTAATNNFQQNSNTDKPPQGG
jgi:hypothetical protein